MRRTATNKNSTTSEIEATKAARQHGRMGAKNPGQPLGQSGDAAAGDHSRGPFTIGGASIMTAADTIVPATKAAGIAKASSRLSTTGM